MPAPTALRVERHTDADRARRIARDIDARIAWYRDHPGEIPARLEELDREWDVERVLQTNAGSVILGGFALGLTVSRLFLALPIVAGSFLLQHALSGWCPPLAVLRRAGVRTGREIARERAALLALQQDGTADADDVASPVAQGEHTEAPVPFG